jgi:hypothetical protein
MVIVNQTVILFPSERCFHVVGAQCRHIVFIGGGAGCVQQVRFLQEFCNLSKHLQLPTRSQLFKYFIHPVSLSLCLLLSITEE